MNKEEMTNLIGNLKLKITKLENLMLSDETDSRVTDVMSEISKICATFEVDKTVELSYISHTTNELEQMKVLTNAQSKITYSTKRARAEAAPI